MNLPIELIERLEENGGMITTAEANSLGISNMQLQNFEKKEYLERVAKGIYYSSDYFLDKMYLFQLRRPKTIYSHETALYLHDITDRDPISYVVTVPTGYNSKPLVKDGLDVFSIKKEYHMLGAIHMETIFGNTILTYNLERTICDCIRSRNQMDIAIVTDAMKRYVKHPDKDINRLMEMAEIFRVKKIIKGYLDVLL